MIIHNHFRGSAYCVECDGPCKLIGDDRAVTELVRWMMERLVLAGWKKLPYFERKSLEGLGVDAESLMRSAAEEVGANLARARGRKKAAYPIFGTYIGDDLDAK